MIFININHIFNEINLLIPTTNAAQENYLHLNILDNIVEDETIKDNGKTMLANNVGNSSSNNNTGNSQPNNTSDSNSNNVNQNPINRRTNLNSQKGNNVNIRGNTVNVNDPTVTLHLHQDLMNYLPPMGALAGMLAAARLAYHMPGSPVSKLAFIGTGGVVGGTLAQKGRAASNYYVSSSTNSKPNGNNTNLGNNGKTNSNNDPNKFGDNNNKCEDINLESDNELLNVGDLLISEGISSNNSLNLSDLINELIKTDFLNNLSIWYQTWLSLLTDNTLAYLSVNNESLNNNYLYNVKASNLNNTSSSSYSSSPQDQHSKPTDNNNSLDSNSVSETITRDPIINDDSLNNDNLNNLSLSDHPWDLLPHIVIYNKVQIIYIFIMFNTFIVNEITNSQIDLYKYIPKNKFGKIINILLTRYINIWKKSYKFLFIGSFIFLLITNFMIKFCLVLILDFFN